jgi:adenylate cyclase
MGMMTNTNDIKTQLEAIVSPEIFDLETNEDFAQSYREQRITFLINRIKLQAKLLVIISLTIAAFFIWVNEGIPGKSKSNHPPGN